MGLGLRPWAPALVQSHHNSMTEVRYLKDVKLVMGPYFVLSVLFPLLPNFPTKMCPVMTRHILVLPRHKFLCLIIHTLCTCFVHAPSLYNRTQNLGLSFSQKDELGPRAEKKKKLHTVVLVCNKDPLLT
jgi:hypothetical protein